MKGLQYKILFTVALSCSTLPVTINASASGSLLMHKDMLLHVSNAAMNDVGYYKTKNLRVPGPACLTCHHRS